MSNGKVTKQELFAACRTLFGDGLELSVGFLNYLQPSGLKSAYRRKALEFHPDRAAATDGDRAQMEERFKAVNKSYRLLCDYLENPSLYELRDHSARGAFWPLGQRCHERGRGRPRPGRYYTGSMPQSPLPLARFLYYSGAISYETLVSSVAWQRMQHNLIGRVAVKSGCLRDKDVLHVIRQCRPFEKFGECAVRTGVMTRRQLDGVLAEQRRLRPLIGSYFSDKGLLSQKELGEFLVRHHSHNRRHQR
jgi:hypothetical protein